MAFKNGLSERLDELRFPSPRSPQSSETTFPGYSSLSPLSPGHSTFVPFSGQGDRDIRSNLQRRFTTDASKLTTSWNYLSNNSTQDPLDLLSSFEQKRLHIQFMREQKLRFEQDMKLLDMEHEKENQEMEQLARDLAQVSFPGPTVPSTPPQQQRESAVTSAVRPGRFSVTSSPGTFDAFSRPSSHTSRASIHSIDRFNGNSLPGSIPGTRRNSDEDAFTLGSPSSFRHGSHRNSLPLSNPPNVFGGGPFMSSSSMNRLTGYERAATPDITSILGITDDDRFPTLIRDGTNMVSRRCIPILALSANPDAHDIVNSHAQGSSGFFHSRTRSSHHSMPKNLHGRQNSSVEHGFQHHHARHSLEGNVFNDRSSDIARPLVQPSFSTNDLPTVKGALDSVISPPRTQGPHNHSVSMGRIHAQPVTNRAMENGDNRDGLGFGPSTSGSSESSGRSTLQASAAPFGPTNPVQYGYRSGPPQYGYQAANLQSGPHMPSSGHGAWPPFRFPDNRTRQNDTELSNSPFSDNHESDMVLSNRFSDNRASQNESELMHTNRFSDNRARQTENELMHTSRFSLHPLSHYEGHILAMCKDQHGCRYLQRKLEEGNPDHLQLIFNEVKMHMIELMTDPFGNYLVQKLLEFCNDEQRTALVHSSAPELVHIAVNQHGTRALQKMIEYITTDEQTETVVRALEEHVVLLVQDLNGNHVIQKCLNRLHGSEAEFIYEAVGGHCLTVGSHRHGCCVLQRCIDHATGDQKARLIGQITAKAYQLVQDPYGNYVVQYILELGEPGFTHALCRMLIGHVTTLSKQKFSSNVMEKCLRTCDKFIRREMVQELMRENSMNTLLHDAYANYVIQTAVDSCDYDMRETLVYEIRPLLHTIRHTPHGRRLASKLAAFDLASEDREAQRRPRITSNASQASRPRVGSDFSQGGRPRIGSNASLTGRPRNGSNHSQPGTSRIFSNGQVTPNEANNVASRTPVPLIQGPPTPAISASNGSPIAASPTDNKPSGADPLIL
ncbi:hypothetical protein N7495_007607 [Penicillium taxi]|uniref:uncharacterized protein n=1 Tax=Penicillium taxi TaxID=168475 RepID=UPI0025458589|nr:uncharacterized protein N7495_007607 [Penicillium taxi]KAJ5887566.1 hypothetical protein N7495_007607 [Penicillium taxi]